MSRICLFCGSSPGHRPAYAEAARAIGEAVARRGHGLVYGGGNVGLMGIAADAALACGGEVVGVIPESLMAREIGHAGLTALHVVPSMHARKALMADLADAFIALPGGFGTFEELFEVVTWAQLGLHAKPCGLLDVDGFYGPLLRFVDHATTEGFIHADARRVLVSGTDAVELVDRVLTQVVPPAPAVITPDER